MALVIIVPFLMYMTSLGKFEALEFKGLSIELRNGNGLRYSDFHRSSIFQTVHRSTPYFRLLFGHVGALLASLGFVPL